MVKRSMTNRMQVRRRERRRGVAPLEFVMSLPVLILMACLGFTWYFTLMGRAETAIEVRRRVWIERGGEESLATSRPLTPLISQYFSPNEGEIQDTLHKSVRGFGGIYGLGGARDVYSGNAVLDGLWDQRQLTEFDEEGPHFDSARSIEIIPPLFKTLNAKVMCSRLRYGVGIVLSK